MEQSRGEELRIALSMRGGVSLAVWIGGAVEELDRLARARPVEAPDVPGADPDARAPDAGADSGAGTDFYGTLLTIAGYDRAVIDVITGASAGGLNGVVLAASRAYGFDFAEMLPIWVRLGDIELLSRDPTATYPDPVTGKESRRPESLLQGDTYFQKRLHTELCELIARGSPDHAVADNFDLILSATLVNPLYETTDADPFAPLPEVRRSANFHFRYLGELGAYGGDFQPVDDAKRDDPDSTSSLLALAGRSTSSFPVAFEQAKVGRAAARVFSDPPAADEPPRRVLDGGVLDNIPVAKAIEAIAAAPVTGLADRWLVFLHPSPSARTAQAAGSQGLASPRALGTLLVTASAAFGQESLLDDLAELERHNAKAAEQRWRRTALLADLDATGELTQETIDASRLVRARLDAARAVKIALGEMRIRRPITEGADRVGGSPWVRGLRRELHHDVADSYDTAYDAEQGPGHEPGAAAGLRAGNVALSASGLLLACDLVGDWLRAVQLPRGADGPTTAVLRRSAARVSDLRSVAQMARNWSDQAWLVAASVGPDAAAAWATTAAEVSAAASRRVPADELRDVAAALGVAAPVLAVNATVLAVDETVDGRALPNRTRALADLDERMRATVGALAVLPDEGAADLGRWIWQNLVAVALDSRNAVDAAAFTPARPPAAAPGDSAVRPTRAPGAPGATWAPDHQERGPDPVNALLAATPADRFGDVLANLVTVLTQAQSVDLESDDAVRFIRITGSNETPLRHDFVDDGEPFGVDQKLCGNDLANFAAFFSARWRANDWMWGRLDAVKSIVDLLVRPERLAVSGVSVDRTVALVRSVAEQAGMHIDGATMTAIEVEVGVAKAGGARSAAAHGTALIRTMLTEAMQRQIFAQMHPVIEQLTERPHWPANASVGGTPAPVDGSEATSRRLAAQMRRYKVGHESLADLDSRRRTQIGMRLAMVGYSAFRPAKRGVANRLGRAAMSAIKPFYLFGAFAALNVARAMFLVNMTAVGFWGGPWRYRGDPAEQRKPWWRLTSGTARLPWNRSGTWWSPRTAPHNWTATAGFVLVVVLSLASLVLALRVKSKRDAARHEHRTPPKGLGWYLASFVGGFAALAVTVTTGLCTGPLLVALGAGVVSLLTCRWMRGVSGLVIVPLGTIAMYVLTGLGFGVYAALKGHDWFRDTGWMSFVALYLAQAFIAVLCTFTSVVYREEELLERAAHPKADGLLKALRSRA